MTTHDANATMNETPAEPTFDPSLPKAGAPEPRVPLNLLLGQLLNGPTPEQAREHDHKVAEHLFTYHPPRPDQLPRYHAIREAGKAMAHVIIDNAPSGPDRSVALRSIREAVMNANSAIANQEVEPTDAPDTQPTG
jgi:hypothetical protein